MIVQVERQAKNRASVFRFFITPVFKLLQSFAFAMQFLHKLWQRRNAPTDGVRQMSMVRMLSAYVVSSGSLVVSCRTRDRHSVVHGCIITPSRVNYVHLLCTYCMLNNATADVGQPTDGNLLMVNNAGSASLRCRPRPLRGLALSRAHRACPRAVSAATPERVRATMTSKSSSRTPSRRGMLGGPRRMTLCCALVMERSGQISPFLYAYAAPG